jgi:alkylation response protein AidB-like acyl-CoA dehydrogenase
MLDAEAHWIRSRLRKLDQMIAVLRAMIDHGRADIAAQHVGLSRARVYQILRSAQDD